MKFAIKNGVIERILWQNADKSSSLVLVKDLEGKFEKRWKVWTKVQVHLNGVYDFSGYVSEQPSQKIKDQNGKAIYETQFNSTNVVDSPANRGDDIIPI